jgi:membrane-bound serine protease (ClpP class)
VSRATATLASPVPVSAAAPIVGRVTGNRTVVRGRLRPLVLLIIVLAFAHTAAAAQTTDPKIDILQVDGALDATIARYIDDALDTAASEDVEVVVLQLSTPGTLDVPADRFVAAISTSPVPVVVWVGPPGARVTGAGVQLAASADVLALAPGAVLGGAVPDGPGDAPTPADRDRIGATLAELARDRGRDEALLSAFAANDAAVVVTPDASTGLSDDAALPAAVAPDRVDVVDEQRAVTDGHADLVAATLPELLSQLDQGLLGRLLHTVSTPTLAYLLLVGGIVCLLFEWFQPGFGVAGISGGVLAGLGLYGMTVLPTQWWAFALVVVGLVLLALDLALASLGPVTAVGVAAFAAGSWWLYAGPGALRLDGWLVALTVVSVAVFFVFIMTTVLRAQGVQTRAGMQAVMGEVGVVRSVLNPQGHVFVGGVLWRAQAPEEHGQVRTGTQVRVTGIADELTLLVEPVDVDERPRRHEIERA